MPLRNIEVISTRDVPRGGVTRKHPVPNAVKSRPSLTLLIHGFNNSQPEAEESYRQFLRTARLAGSPLQAGQVCVVFWPGDHGALRYYQEIDRAKECASMLLEYLDEIRGESELEVSLVCHSLGNRLALELIAAHNRRGGLGIRFSRAAMMAAAVPLDFVDSGGSLSNAAVAIARSEIYFSGADEALGLVFVGGQRLAGEPCVGAVGKTGGPLGRWTLSVDFTPYGHGDYWAEPESALTVRALFGLATVRYTPHPVAPPAMAGASGAPPSPRNARAHHVSLRRRRRLTALALIAHFARPG